MIILYEAIFGAKMFIRWEGTQEMRTESSTNVDVIAVEALIEADGR